MTGQDAQLKCGVRCQALHEKRGAADAFRTGAIGAGQLANALCKHLAKLHALEAETPNISYREVSVEDLAAEQPESFDVVTCMEMMEHVPDPAAIVAACAKLVKPGGTVFFSTINRNPKSFLFAIVGAEYVLNMLPKGTHTYAKFIKPAELAAFCRAADLEVKRTRGLEYNPLTKHYWLSDDTSVNYMFATTKAP